MDWILILARFLLSSHAFARILPNLLIFVPDDELCPETLRRRFTLGYFEGGHHDHGVKLRRTPLFLVVKFGWVGVGVVPT